MAWGGGVHNVRFHSGEEVWGVCVVVGAAPCGRVRLREQESRRQEKCRDHQLEKGEHAPEQPFL